ncbi:MAG: hypothetical protein KKB30_03495 [Proteobacteria bacterium]|nr:hypothetical protein [Pseudomonadota bacterium]
MWKIIFVMPQGHKSRTSRLAAQLGFNLLVFPVVLMLCGISLAASETTIKIVETDQAQYINEYVEIKGELDISSNYKYGYSKAKNTHFAFKLTDKTGTANVYLKKDDGYVLRNKIIKNNRPIKGEFGITIKRNRYQPKARKVFADLESW